MPFESSNPFLPPRSTHVDRKDLAESLLGFAGRAAARHISSERKRNIVHRAEKGADEMFATSSEEEANIERYEMIRRLLRLGQGLTEQIEQPYDRGVLCASLARTERRIPGYEDHSFPLLQEVLEEYKRRPREVMFSHLLIEILKDKMTPRSVIDEVGTYTVFIESPKKSKLYAETLWCERDIQDGRPIDEERLQALIDSKAELFGKDFHNRHGVEMALSLARIQHLLGQDTSKSMEDAAELALHAEEGNVYAEVGIQYAAWGQYERAFGMVERLNESYYRRVILLSIVNAGEAPKAIRQRAHEWMCRSIADQGPTDTAEDLAAHVLSRLRIRQDLMKGECEFGTSPYPEFSSWIKEQLQMVAPDEAPDAYLIWAKMNIIRGEDPSEAYEGAKKAAAQYSLHAEVVSLLKIIEAETENGSDNNETRDLLERLLSRVTHCSVRLAVYRRLAGVALQREPELVERYVRLGVEELARYGEQIRAEGGPFYPESNLQELASLASNAALRLTLQWQKRDVQGIKEAV